MLHSVALAIFLDVHIFVLLSLWWHTMCRTLALGSLTNSVSLRSLRGLLGDFFILLQTIEIELTD